MEALVHSYVVRKRFEASLIALEVGRLFAGGKQKQGKQLTPEEMWAELDSMG